MANTAPTETVLAVQTATLEDSVPLTPNADHVGLNATMYSLITGDVAAGLIFPNTGKEILIIRSASAAEVIITVDCPIACDQGYTTVHDNISHIQVGNATATYKILGPFPTSRWNATYGEGTLAVTNHVKFTADSYANVQAMVVKTPIV